MVTAIVGANWGDEGKGKITDLLANDSDIVIRFQGGANAGHTIINEHGRFALHLMPSGVCHDNIVNIIGNGVALDIHKFINEYNEIKERGLNPQLLVSDRVQVVMPYHVDFDKFEEERLGGKAFGSTKSGMSCIARTFGAPVSVPAGKTALRRSNASSRSRMRSSLISITRIPSTRMNCWQRCSSREDSSSLLLPILRHSCMRLLRPARRSFSKASSEP